jgi:hypothetical protein
MLMEKKSRKEMLLARKADTAFTNVLPSPVAIPNGMPWPEGMF